MMKLELAVLAILCAVVPSVVSQMDPVTLLTLMNPDIKLPPKPPTFLLNDYQTRQQLLQRRKQQLRLQQEQRLLQQLRSMNRTQLEELKATLTPNQLHHLVQRLKYLVKQEAQARTGNVVLSGANRIRKPGTSPNSVGSGGGSGGGLLGGSGGGGGGGGLLGGGGGGGGATTSPGGDASKTSSQKMHPLYYLRKYRKAGLAAVADRCSFPLPDLMASFFAFRHKGCRGGGGQFCQSRGLMTRSLMTCVDVQQSILCCPMGYTSRGLEMTRYMREMQRFMAEL